MKLFIYIICITLVLSISTFANAFVGEGCAEGECKDCHALSKKDAETMLKGVTGNVLNVEFSEVPGLWVVDLEQKGKKIPVYVDFSKQYLITGRVVKLETMENVAEKRFLNLNKIDVSIVPLDDAVIIGNPEAPLKIIVFDDPECAYCKKLHPEMKKVVSLREDIAFFIKMFPLKTHPTAYDKAKTIICEKSAKLLEDSLNGKEIPPPTCETDQVDKNIALGRKIFVRSTPTLVFPDGSVIPGYKRADRIISLLNEKGREKESQAKKKEQ